MAKQLSILAPTRYPWRFNSPRHSRHDISIRKFLPMNRLSYKLEGVTAFNPWPPKRFDLIHSFNRIPLSTLPFVVGFELHMPRAFGLEHTAFYKAMANRLAHDKCRRLIAISDYARRHLLRQHAGQPWEQAIASKLEVRFPNLDLPTAADSFNPQSDKIRLVFVGHHFGRKGGAAVVRLAELARTEGLPLEIDFISKFEVGIMSWVDPLRAEFFESDRAKLASLPNIHHHEHLDNALLLQKISAAHFLLLPTLADTFGFSLIEAMANHTPVITTAQGPAPEFVEDGKNGALLSLQTDSHGDWLHMKRSDRDTPAYEALFRDTNEQLAQEMLVKLKAAFAQPANYLQLRKNARATAERCFCAQAASRYWDDLYERAVA